MLLKVPHYKSAVFDETLKMETVNASSMLATGASFYNSYDLVPANKPPEWNNNNNFFYGTAEQTTN